MIPKLGVVKYDREKPVKLVTKKGKEQIYSELNKAGMSFDSSGFVSGKNVDGFFKSIENVIGDSAAKKVNTDNIYEYITAHGANQILDNQGNEVFTFIENAAHPVKTFAKSVVNIFKKA